MFFCKYNDPIYVKLEKARTFALGCGPGWGLTSMRISFQEALNLGSTLNGSAWRIPLMLVGTRRSGNLDASAVGKNQSSKEASSEHIDCGLQGAPNFTLL